MALDVEFIEKRCQYNEALVFTTHSTDGL